MRQPLVMGNWKMHGSTASVQELLSGLQPSERGAEVVVCPSFVHLSLTIEQLKAQGGIEVGGQDCSHVASGAYTGEVSATMLADLGCSWVILGHSERRQYHSESDGLVAAKAKAVAEAGLTPVICVGETREERENGNAHRIVATQLEGALDGQGELAGLVIAYEPVWAIGTGLTATSEQAQEMHAYIRERLGTVALVDAEATRILYGGSVKPGNAAELFANEDIDGALVGGASLVAEDFNAIIAAA